MEEKAINAMLISPADDVATVIADLHKGDDAVFQKNGEIVQVPIIETIPKFHKIALRNINKNENVRKYGEVIGQATKNICQGSHVHDHNITSPISADEERKI